MKKEKVESQNSSETNEANEVKIPLLELLKTATLSDIERYLKDMFYAIQKAQIEAQKQCYDELEHAQAPSFVNLAETNESRARGLARRLFMKKVDNVGLHLSASEADLVAMYSECERIANIIVNVILLDQGIY